MKTPAFTSLIACATVGYMSQTGPVITVSGAEARLVGHVGDGEDLLFRRRLDDAEALGIDHVDAGIDLGDRRLLGLRRIEEGADEGRPSS